MTDIDDVADRMYERGAEFIVRLERTEQGRVEQSTAFGVVLVDDGRFMAVEAGLDPDGVPCVTVSSFDESGEPSPPKMFDLDGSVMIVP